jgi:hypothetical protein
MPDRLEYQQEVHNYLQKHFSAHNWIFSLPQESGVETYSVKGDSHEYFVRVSASVERYLIMAEVGLTPPVLSFGNLDNGRSILVQPLVTR